MSEEFKKRAVTDEEAENDLLNLDNYVHACAQFIIECNTPMSIAVIGGWGAGKSSFINLVKKELKKIETDEMKTVFVDFNTWQFSRIGERKLFIPLLTQLKENIDEENKAVPGYKEYFKKGGANDIKFPVGALVGDALYNIGGLVDFATGSFLTVIGTILHAISVSNRNKHSKDGKNLTEEEIYKETVLMRKKLQDRIDILVGKTEIKQNKLVSKQNEANKRLIVFVDDLDRLAPVDAVSLLEDMKNFMDCKETVFVLALDHNLVKRGVFEKYKNSDDETIDGSYAGKFFEKIVQIPFYLPTSKYDVKNYIVSLINELHIEGLDPDKCLSSIRRFSDGTPRVIKRAMNLYQLNASILDSDSTLYNPDGLFALILLQMSNDTIFADLCEDLSDIKEKYRIIKSFEKIDFNNNFVDEFLRTAKHPEEYSYLLKVYPDFSELYNAVMRSIYSEKGAELSKDEQLDEIYKLLCSYLSAKGCQVTKKLKNPEGTIFVYKNRQKFVVKRFTENTNINFMNIEKNNRQKYIDPLLHDKLIQQSDDKSFTFNDSEGTNIKNDLELFIRNVTNNPGVLTAIGKIVSTLLKEAEEAEEAEETEPAKKSAK